LQNAGEVVQMLLRMFTLTIGRKGKPHRRRNLAGSGPFVTHIGPQATGFRCAASGCEHRNWRVVGVHDIGGNDMRTQRVRERREQGRCLAYPLREQRAIQVYAFACVDLCLSVKRYMIAVFADEHVRQKPRTRHTALDRSWRCGRLHDRIAARAG